MRNAKWECDCNCECKCGCNTTRQRAEPPLLQLAFAKWVLKSILDICLDRSMSKCVVFLKCCAVHLKKASACQIELCSCRTMSVAILLEPYVAIRLSVYFCNKASKFPFSEIAADVEAVRGSSLGLLDIAIVKSPGTCAWNLQVKGLKSCKLKWCSLQKSCEWRIWQGSSNHQANQFRLVDSANILVFLERPHLPLLVTLPQEPSTFPSRC